MSKTNWGRAGRDDYIDPPGMTEEEKAIIADLELSPYKGMKTIINVTRTGITLGQVRTTFGGQVYRKDGAKDFLIAACKWNTTDPEHGRAMLELVRDTKESD